MELTCEFSFPNYTPKYKCTVKEVKFNESETITILGKHLNGQCTSHVTFLDMRCLDLYEVPRKVGQLFPNLRTLMLSENKITEISRDDFLDFPKLRTLCLRSNGLTALPDKVFEHVADLVWLSLVSKPIAKSHSNSFEPLNKLKFLSMADGRITDAKWTNMDAYHRQDTFQWIAGVFARRNPPFDKNYDAQGACDDCRYRLLESRVAELEAQLELMQTAHVKVQSKGMFRKFSQFFSK